MLITQHDILHEGAELKSGRKYALRTGKTHAMQVHTGHVYTCIRYLWANGAGNVYTYAHMCARHALAAVSSQALALHVCNVAIMAFPRHPGLTRAFTACSYAVLTVAVQT